ncbi:hypothetical protein PoB_000758200 [Plakobranchus ocellatus]|uniref:Uncharacterized protein n=1 Tax=Plakobranchus ocellatus TaxID=259542 RepID=A0AAV3YDW9_9GAST|nr:hypothetical protein PoB_000758200 [Plakobranchus ocellatus]
MLASAWQEGKHVSIQVLNSTELIAMSQSSSVPSVPIAHDRWPTSANPPGESGMDVDSDDSDATIENVSTHQLDSVNGSSHDSLNQENCSTSRSVCVSVDVHHSFDHFP